MLIAARPVERFGAAIRSSERRIPCHLRQGGLIRCHYCGRPLRQRRPPRADQGCLPRRWRLQRRSWVAGATADINPTRFVVLGGAGAAGVLERRLYRPWCHRSSVWSSAPRNARQCYSARTCDITWCCEENYVKARGPRLSIRDAILRIHIVFGLPGGHDGKGTYFGCGHIATCILRSWFCAQAHQTPSEPRRERKMSMASLCSRSALALLSLCSRSALALLSLCGRDESFHLNYESFHLNFPRIPRPRPHRARCHRNAPNRHPKRDAIPARALPTPSSVRKIARRVELCGDSMSHVT